jgi:hypothetical protein
MYTPNRFIAADAVERQRASEFLKPDHALTIRIEPAVTQVTHDQPEIRVGVLEHEDLAR